MYNTNLEEHSYWVQVTCPYQLRPWTVTTNKASEGGMIFLRAADEHQDGPTSSTHQLPIPDQDEYSGKQEEQQVSYHDKEKLPRHEGISKKTL